MNETLIMAIAFTLLFLVTNYMQFAFVTDNNKNEHYSILQNVYAQAAQSKQKPSTSLVSEAIAPVLLIPIATSGNNVYLVWSDNKAGNYEIMFRASSDRGNSFGNKINLSNSPSESHNAEIQSSGDRVYVTWWERNSTNNTPVLRISDDDGRTFGPTLKLSFNGPIDNR
jgi:hypothetical protein